jgi:hypothetical protein
MDDYRSSKEAINTVFDLALKLFVLISTALYMTDEYYRFIVRTKFQIYFGIIEGHSEKEFEV